MPRLSTLRATVATSWVSLSCISSAVAPSPPEPEAPTTEASQPFVEASPAPPEVPMTVVDVELGGIPQLNLVDPGAMPRIPMRLAIPDGQHERMELTARTRITMQYADTPGTIVDVPPLRETVALSITRPSEDVIAMHSKLERVEMVPTAGVDPTMRAILEKLVPQMRDVTTDVRLTPYNVVLEGQTRFPEALPDEVADLVRESGSNWARLQTPLPDRPVGVGAVWTVDSHANMKGLGVFQTTTYRVAAIDGSTITLDMSLKQRHDGTPYVPPGMPAESDPKLERMQSTGLGRLRLDLRRAAPLESKTHVTIDVEMSFVAMGERVPIEVQTTMEVDQRAVD